jgi:hypothetical protein
VTFTVCLDANVLELTTVTISLSKDFIFLAFTLAKIAAVF